MYTRIPYKDLNSRQKENYNFQKVAARLADYGFNSIRLSDDWQGADFIAVHIDGETFLKVQLKARLAINRIYEGRGVRIAFLLEDDLYLYDHDGLVAHMEQNSRIGADSVTWHQQGKRSWPSPPAWAMIYLSAYRLPAMTQCVPFVSVANAGNRSSPKANDAGAVAVSPAKARKAAAA